MTPVLVILGAVAYSGGGGASSILPVLLPVAVILVIAHAAHLFFASRSYYRERG
jgi:hypothetical protein